MTEKTLTTENIKPALDALRGELAPWPVVAMKQDRLNDTQKSAVNSGITSSLVAQIIANTAAIRALESAITGTGLRALVVTSLPAIGTQGILYIVPVTTYDPATDADVVNYSNEYIWIVAPDAPVTEGYYEQVGQTGIVINNGQLTITVNGTSVGTFTANQSGDTTAAITVPTNADYVDKTTAQSIAGVKTFSDGIVSNVTGNVTGDLTGTASKAIADEDGTSIKTGYGKLAGNQTWTGSNTFTDSLTFKNNAVVVGATTGYGYSAFNYVDSNNSSIAYHRVSKFTSGNTCLQWKIYNTNNNSESISAEIQYYLTKTGERVFTPNSNGDTTLGTSSYRWSSVYADSYYYGTTAWGLDKSNVWSASNTFNQAVISNSSFWITSADLQAKNQSTLISARLNKIGNESSDGKAFQKFEMKVDATYSETAYCVNYYNTSGNIAYDFVIRQRVDNQGTKQFYPSVSGAADLGTSTNKWKTLNGVNPGALSDIDSSVSITMDTTNWAYDGSWKTLSTATALGWGYIIISDCGASDYISIRYGGTNKNYPCINFTPHLDTNSKYYLCALFQVVKNQDCRIKILSTGTLSFALFYPCLGNV